MPATVQCGKCNTPLNEASNLPIEEREPCPACGSTTRSINVTAQAAAVVGSTASVVVTRAEVVADATSLLIQAVLVPGGKTPQGVLVAAVAPPWVEIIRMLEKDPSLAFRIDPRKWEEIIAGAYRKAGFEEVQLTARSGDYGRDVIATKRGLGTVRIIDQVKAFKPGHLVKANDVRALMGVLQTDGACKGFLTTTSDFAPRIRTDPLIVPFMPSRLELINGATLLKRLTELAHGEDGK